jgi:hypothetical protein
MEKRHGFVDPTPEQVKRLDEHFASARPAKPDQAQKARRVLAEHASEFGPRPRRVPAGN